MGSVVVALEKERNWDGGGWVGGWLMGGLSDY